MHLWSLALLLKTAAAGLASELWRENSATAQQSLWDPFVLGLGAGTLKKETFATYVAQDAGFLKSFAYAKKWGADLGKDFKPLKATIDYTSFLEKISRDPTASAAEVVAAMVPCMTLYAILGKRLEKAGIEDDNPYREWVETYASDEFWEAKEQAEGLLDVLTPHGCERCGDLYAEAMRLEHSFFAAQDVAPDWIRLTSSFRARLEASLSGASLRAGAEMEL